MKKTRRTAQVGDIVRAEVAEIIRREFADPALDLITITDVEMSTDLRYAKVFVTRLGAAEEIDHVVEVLQKAAGRIRYMVGQRASLRYNPELVFKADTTGLRATAIEDILKEVLPQGGDVRNDDES